MIEVNEDITYNFGDNELRLRYNLGNSIDIRFNKNAVVFLLKNDGNDGYINSDHVFIYTEEPDNYEINLTFYQKDKVIAVLRYKKVEVLEFIINSSKIDEQINFIQKIIDYKE